MRAGETLFQRRFGVRVELFLGSGEECLSLFPQGTPVQIGHLSENPFGSDACLLPPAVALLTR